MHAPLCKGASIISQLHKHIYSYIHIDIGVYEIRTVQGEAITLTHSGLLPAGPSGTDFCEILYNSFLMHLKRNLWN